MVKDLYVFTKDVHEGADIKTFKNVLERRMMKVSILSKVLGKRLPIYYILRCSFTKTPSKESVDILTLDCEFHRY